METYLGTGRRTLSSVTVFHRRWQFGALAKCIARYWILAALVTIALATRLPLLSVSLDEVDAANFFNALDDGYDIALMKPHPPGYPVYVFMGSVLNGAVHNPFLSLTLLSALLGSFSVVPFYLLSKEMAGGKVALVGTLLFIFNPLTWSFSETALTDVPSMFFVLVLAWLAYRARFSDGAFLSACVVSSIAIGIRQPNVALVLLLAFPLGYRFLVLKTMSWRLPLFGAGLFLAATLAWAMPMVYIGSNGPGDYLDAVSRQWSGAVRVFDITQVSSPWLMNALFRVERFFFGYFLTYSWTGDDAKTRLTFFMILPWLFGFALFVTGFNYRNSRHVFLALWIASILYTTAVIHFLPRYGLAQIPGFIIASLFGYQFLASTLLKHPRYLQILSTIGIGSALILLGIKYQSPVSTFEFTPPDGSLFAGVLLTLGIAVLLAARRMYRKLEPTQPSPNNGSNSHTEYGRQKRVKFAMIGVMLLIVVPFAIKGYAISSVAHNAPNPNQQLVEYVAANYDTSRVTPCWDHQSHSFFDALTDTTPVGFWSANELYDAYDSGNTLVATDRCLRLSELNSSYRLTEVAVFTGASPVWSKTPSVTLYVAERQ